jgi:hypothetical protein
MNEPVIARYILDILLDIYAESAGTQLSLFRNTCLETKTPEIPHACGVEEGTGVGGLE